MKQTINIGLDFHGTTFDHRLSKYLFFKLKVGVPYSDPYIDRTMIVKELEALGYTREDEGDEGRCLQYKLVWICASLHCIPVTNDPRDVDTWRAKMARRGPAPNLFERPEQLILYPLTDARIMSHTSEHGVDRECS